MSSSSSALRLNQLLAEVGEPVLDPVTAERFIEYLRLIERWNQRVNLTAIRAEEEILKRHFVESIACARALPEGIGTLLDFGSGAGFPGIPIALCCPEISVTLAESQAKKAAFLREAARRLGIAMTVHADRAETLRTEFGCVAMRAVDQMQVAIPAAARLVKLGGWQAVMTTLPELEKVFAAAGPDFRWSQPKLLPWSIDRVVVTGEKCPPI